PGCRGGGARLLSEQGVELHDHRSDRTAALVPSEDRHDVACVTATQRDQAWLVVVEPVEHLTEPGAHHLEPAAERAARVVVRLVPPPPIHASPTLRPITRARR